MSSPFKIDGVDSVTSGLPKKVVTLYGTAAITAGDSVMIDTASTTYGLGASVEKSDVSNQEEGLVCGIAIETISAAGFIQIQTAGKYSSANVAASVEAGDPLVASGTAGRLQDIETAVGTAVAAADFNFLPIAVSLEADTSNVAAVMIIDRGWF